MFFYEKNGKINALSRVEDGFGRIAVSFFSSDKEKFVKKYHRRLIAGWAIFIACFIVSFLFTDSIFGVIVAGFAFFVMLCIMTSLDGSSLISLFSKDSAMTKFQLDSKRYKADNANRYISVYSNIFAAHGTADFWEKFIELDNDELLAEAVEIAVNESILEDAIKGMKEYVSTSSENAIRTEVLLKLHEAHDKLEDLVERFNNFEKEVLQSTDPQRDHKVLQHMETVEHLNIKAA